MKGFQKEGWGFFWHIVQREVGERDLEEMLEKC